ncbi:hypothetical protein V8G54_024668 [Vigna mungo]|uniref:Uncharacterized protein n=1 Tax=Vigna mungo TaxID=3915 RepID=A0AAQ3N7C3_VIGMU
MIHNYHLSCLLWYSFPAVLQDLHAVLVAPVMQNPLHVNGISRGNGDEHVTSNMSDSIKVRCSGNHMRQVKVDAFDVRVSPDNLRKRASNATSHVNQRLNLVKPISVAIDDSLGDKLSGAHHPLIEQSVVVRVQPCHLKLLMPMAPEESSAVFGAFSDNLTDVVSRVEMNWVVLQQQEWC